MEFNHISVMPEEAIAALDVKPDGFYVDATLGGAGHARRICSLLSEKGRFLGIDQDADAIVASSERLQGMLPQVEILRANFSSLKKILQGRPQADGILFDLGISSHQIDEASRGFSYMQDGPLDMRMDRTQELTAATVVNRYTVAELARIFREYGEERWGKRIAEFIAENRPITTTAKLNDIIDRAIPKAVRRNMNGHPAKRIFQALRIEVNGELKILSDAIRDAADILKPGGRIAVITFHSLEDRIVKEIFKDLSRDCICPPEIPVCVCRHQASLRLLGKAKAPGQAEIAANPRAKSAKLRAAVKL